MSYKQLKVIVTGGAGFIGSHIAEGLVAQGAQVIILDNLSTGKKENIQHLPSNQVEFIQGSITDLSLLQKAFKSADYVFHEAAIASVPQSMDDPLKTNETNLTGTLNVLIAARDNGVKKVVFASSSAVYGDTPALYKKEDQSPNPLSPYAVGKLSSEYYCEVFNTAFHLPNVCLRYFNVYGPRQNPYSEYAAVIPKFIQRIKEGKSPIIFGDGEQSRDFVFIKDVVAVNLQVAENKATGVFNIGTGQKTTLNQLTRMILKLTEKIDIRPVYEKERIGDIKHSLADISRARSFGYIPEYDIQRGLKELIG